MFGFAGELLIIFVGIFKWFLKGCKTDISDEIYGKKGELKNTRLNNFFIGILIIIIFVIVLFSI